MTNPKELKTLKEIDNIFYYHSPNKSDSVVRIRDLKAEAVKHIKKMSGIMYDDERHYSVIWIKHFFNITEEDLK